MKKRIGLAISVLILALIVGGWGTVVAKEKPSGEPIVFGASLSLSGWMAPWDTTALNSLKLFVEDLNAKGGLLGRPVKIVTADTKSDFNLSATAANEVLGKGADVVMTSCDYDMSAGAINVTMSKGIMSCSACAGSSKYIYAAPLTFSMGSLAQNDGALLAEFAYKELGKRAAVLVLDDTVAYTRDAQTGFEQRWIEMAGEKTILARETFFNQDPSVASQISSIKSLATKPDVIFLSSYPPGGASFIRQARAAGIEATILGPNSFDGDFWISSIPDLSNFYHITFGSLWGDDPDSFVNDLVNRYEKTFGEKAAMALSLIGGYSFGQAVTKAIETAGTVEGKAVAASFEKFQTDEFLLPVNFSPKSHITKTRAMRVLEIVKGKNRFKTLYKPERVPGFSD